MDLSPKLLTDVQFREQWRGYNPDEVDEFLERVAAGVEELQQRLIEATERASSAERRLLERSDEDEIRRTLVLAQRTAVASMEEARVEADRMVSETEARCRHMVAEAEAHAARLEADIATRRRLELGDLAEQRAALQLDIDHLRAYLDDERTRLGDVLRAQVEWIESGYALSELPSISDIAPPSPLLPSAPVEMRAPETIAAQPLDEPEADASEEPEGLEDTFASIAAADEREPEVAGSPVDDLRLAREELADALRRAGVDAEDDERESDRPDAHVAVVPEPAPLQLEPQLPRPALFDDRSGGEPTGAFDAVADDAAPRVEDDPQPEWRDETEEEDDPFLAELRRAVVDTEPLGPRDHHDHPAPRAYEDGDSSGGFFRRGRRRS